MIDPADHRGLAHGIAQRFVVAHRIPAHAREDVHGDALEGLCKAARDFDPSRGATFATYATHRIRGQILDGLRQRDAVGRRTRQLNPEQLAPLSLDALEGFDAPAPDDLDRLHDRLHAATILRRARRILTRRQAQAIAAWLDEDTSQVELARRQGVSEAAITQHKKSGLAKLRKAFAA